MTIELALIHVPRIRRLMVIPFGEYITLYSPCQQKLTLSGQICSASMCWIPDWSLRRSLFEPVMRMEFWLFGLLWLGWHIIGGNQIGATASSWPLSHQCWSVPVFGHCYKQSASLVTPSDEEEEREKEPALIWYDHPRNTPGHCVMQTLSKWWTTVLKIIWTCCS